MKLGYDDLDVVTLWDTMSAVSSQTGMVPLGTRIPPVLQSFSGTRMEWSVVVIKGEPTKYLFLLSSFNGIRIRGILGPRQGRITFGQ